MSELPELQIGQKTIIGWNDSLNALQDRIGKDVIIRIIKPKYGTPKYTVELFKMSDSTYVENYEFLLSFITPCSDYRNMRTEWEKQGTTEWAKQLAKCQDTSDKPESLYLLQEREEARRLLLVHIRDKNEDTSKWKSSEQALDALLTCVKYDMANALHVMKIDRDDPECPRGFLWCTAEKLKNINIYWKNKKMERPAITHKYLKYASKFNPSKEYMENLNDLLKTKIPEWLL